MLISATYAVLLSDVLRPLDRLAAEADATWLADLVDCLTRLVQNLSLRDDWVPDEDNS